MEKRQDTKCLRVLILEKRAGPEKAVRRENVLQWTTKTSKKFELSTFPTNAYSCGVLNLKPPPFVQFLCILE